MKFYIRHWYSLNLIVALVLIVYLALSFESLATVQVLVLLNFVALIFHQFEEYGFPGGEPMIMNYVLQKSDIPDRFPLNQFSAMFTNVPVAWTFYGIAFFFPDVIWLCLAPMIFNIGQLIVHGVATNKAMKSIYNPGLFSVVFLHLPISIYFVWFVYSQDLIVGIDWLWAILMAMFCGGFLVGFLTYAVFANRDSRWPFAPVEMERFNVKEKLTAKGIVIEAGNGATKGPFAIMQKIQRKLHGDKL